MDGRYYALQDLPEEAQEVEIRHAKLVHQFAEFKGEESILGRVHESREEAVLDKYSGQLLHIVLLPLAPCCLLALEQVRDLFLQKSKSFLVLLSLEFKLFL